eukprot:Rhum_TRINITY_DN11907_c0_g2::Rhum_TRINITY_DN11907_c0_g2_i1::g.47815::m.47815
MGDPHTEVELVNALAAAVGPTAASPHVTAEEWAAASAADACTVARLRHVERERRSAAAAAADDDDDDSAAAASAAEGLRAAAEHLAGLRGGDGQAPPPPPPPPLPTPAPEAMVSLQAIDSLFRKVLRADRYVAMLRDGVPHGGDLDNLELGGTVDVGCALLDYSQGVEDTMKDVHRAILSLRRELSRRSEASDDGDSDSRASSSAPRCLARWSRVPPEIAGVLLRWVTHLWRTSSLLSTVVAMVSSREALRATESEMQHVDFAGLVVSTVRTPLTKAGWCWMLGPSWFVQPTWRRRHVVLWQQFLYFFDGDADDDRCQSCLLLRGCRLSAISSHRGKRNVLSLSHFLYPFAARVGEDANPRISFDDDASEWRRSIQRAISAPPVRETELLISALHRQILLELATEGSQGTEASPAPS